MAVVICFTTIIKVKDIKIQPLTLIDQDFLCLDVLGFKIQ